MRAEPATEMERSPLILVLSQIRFNPVLKMSGIIPDIQEAMRGAGLVRFAQEETQQFVFGQNKINQSTRWVFGDRDKSEAVILTNDFFIYQVSQYTVFDHFVDRLVELFKQVQEFAKLAFSNHVGLRFVDYIAATDDFTANDFLTASLRGLTANELGVESTNNQFAIQSKTEMGTLFVRSIENTGDKFLPPDLQTEHLKFLISTKDGDEFRILDFDHLSPGEVEFSEIKSKFWGLHKNIKLAFNAAVTQDALDYWGGDNT